MSNTDIGYDTSVKDAIEILEKNEMDSFTVSQSETFSGIIDREFTLEELKIFEEYSDNPSNELCTFLENQGDTYSDDYELDSECDLNFDFWDVNHDIREKNMTKITTGEDLLEYATNNLPDVITIRMDLTTVCLEVTVGSPPCFREKFDFTNNEYPKRNRIMDVKKSDVLKSLSSNTDKWTQSIKNSNSLQEVMSWVIKTTYEDYTRCLDLTLEGYDCEFDSDFKVNNKKFALGN
jgi:hypothetical protein